MKIAGAASKTITGRVLTGSDMNTVNTFAQPDAVRPAPFNGIKVENEKITLNLPSKSVVVLEIR